jgi:uncharacterized repeat protein (TIGR01451 family)
MIVGCLYFVPGAQGQDDDRRPVTLGDRIEQLRSDVTGERVQRPAPRSTYQPRSSHSGSSSYRDDSDDSARSASNKPRGQAARPYNPDLYRDYRTEEYQKTVQAARVRRQQEQQLAEEEARLAEREARLAEREAQAQAARRRRLEPKESYDDLYRNEDLRGLQSELGPEPLPQPTPPKTLAPAIDGRGSVATTKPKPAEASPQKTKKLLTPQSAPLVTQSAPVEVEPEFIPPDPTPQPRIVARSAAPAAVATKKTAAPEASAREAEVKEVAAKEPISKPPAAEIVTGPSSRRTATGDTARAQRMRATEMGEKESRTDEDMSSKVAKHTAQVSKQGKTLLAPEAQELPAAIKTEVEPDLTPSAPFGLALAPKADPPAGTRPITKREVSEVTVSRPSIAEVSSLITSKSPVLALEAVGPRKIVIGKEQNYEINLSNHGDTVSNVIVYVQIPSTVEVSSYQGDTGTVRPPVGVGSGEPYEWHVPTIEAAGKQTLSLKIVPRKGSPFELGMRYVVNQELQQATVEVQEPKLVMTLAGPADVMYGESKIYKLAITNPGTGDAENVLVSLSPLGRGAEATASHRVGTLRPGESRMIEVELTAREAGELVIKAQASAEGGLRSDAVEQVTVRRANLALEVKSPKELYAQTSASYNVQVSNQGNATAEHVQVTAQLPSDAEFRSASAGGQLSPDHSCVVWNVGALPAGSVKDLGVKCVLQSPGDNPLQVTANADTDLASLAHANTRVIAVADLKLEVRDPQGPVAVGDDAVYEVVLKNRGSKAAEQVLVRAFFSEGLEASSVQGALAEIHAGKGEVIFEPIPKIEAGTEVIYRIHTLADRAGNHVFHAQVTCDNVASRLAAEQTTLFYADSSAAGHDGIEQARKSDDGSRGISTDVARQSKP